VKTSKKNLLTVADTDRIISKAAKPQMGAIEDATETATSVIYFFERGVAGEVCRRTGAVKIVIDPIYR
jgi:hypothetical protein